MPRFALHHARVTAPAPAGGSAPHEELFYTQPGNPLDARNAVRRSQRSRTLGFTITDTVESLKAKEAVRAGLTPAEMEAYRDVESMAHYALVAGTPTERKALLPEALAADSATEEMALRLAETTGHGRSWGTLEKAGSLAAVLEARLTTAEKELLASGISEDDLLADVATYETMVQSYKAIGTKVRRTLLHRPPYRLHTATSLRFPSSLRRRMCKRAWRRRLPSAMPPSRA